LNSLLSTGKEISERTIFDFFEVHVKNIGIYVQAFQQGTKLLSEQPLLTDFSSLKPLAMFPILYPLSFSLNLFKSIAPEDGNIPRFKLMSNVDLIRLGLHDGSVTILAQVVNEYEKAFQIKITNSESRLKTKSSSLYSEKLLLEQTNVMNNISMDQPDLEKLGNGTVLDIFRNNVPLHSILVDLNLNIKMVEMILSHNHLDSVEDIIKFRISAVDSTVVFRPYDFSFSMRIGVTYLEDCLLSSKLRVSQTTYISEDPGGIIVVEDDDDSDEMKNDSSVAAFRLSNLISSDVADCPSANEIAYWGMGKPLPAPPSKTDFLTDELPKTSSCTSLIVPDGILCSRFYSHRYQWNEKTNSLANPLLVDVNIQSYLDACADRGKKPPECL
jgi:hypothetical protein